MWWARNSANLIFQFRLENSASKMSVMYLIPKLFEHTCLSNHPFRKLLLNIITTYPLVASLEYSFANTRFDTRTKMSGSSRSKLLEGFLKALSKYRLHPNLKSISKISNLPTSILFLNSLIQSLSSHFISGNVKNKNFPTISWLCIFMKSVSIFKLQKKCRFKNSSF